MSKTSKTLAILCLFLFVSFTRAARPLPSSHQDSPPQQLLSDDGLNVASSEGCEGVGEEECLMRRTLVAHLDYIYTQGKKKP